MLCIARLVWLACAFLALAFPVFAQAPLPPYEPHRVHSLAFRPGNADQLLFGLTDDDGRVQIHLLRLGADGKAVVLRTLPGSHGAAAWLDAHTVVTALDKS